MSMLVTVYGFDENGQEFCVELERGKELAGFESSRNKLYGSDLAESLGLTLLPQLKKNDLWIPFEQLDDLKGELELILENVADFSKVSGYDQEYIEARVGNILDAIDLAKKVNGKVVVW